MAKFTAHTTVEGMNAALRALPREANAKLRDASVAITSVIAAEASSRARSQGGVAALVAPTIRAARDRYPLIRMGSSKVLPTEGDGWKRKSRKGGRQTVGDVMWGAEFGGGARPVTRQFRPHLGQTGYFLWPTVRDRSDETAAAYSRALLDALEAI